MNMLCPVDVKAPSARTVRRPHCCSSGAPVPSARFVRFSPGLNLVVPCVGTDFRLCCIEVPVGIPFELFSALVLVVLGPSPR